MYQVREFAAPLLLLALLALLIICSLARYFTLPNTDGECAPYWLRHRRANHVAFLLALIVWCSLARMYFSVATFWTVPLTSNFLLLLTLRLIDTRVLERRWTAQDIFRLALWGSVHPCLTILLMAMGFERSYERRLSAPIWLLAAGVAAVVGSMRLRSAQGFKKRRVKSGTLYARTLQLAKKMGVSIKWIYVIPPGRGTLTNAFAPWRGVALTDNFGEYLRGPQLDYVIAHELAHNKNNDGKKHFILLLTLPMCLAVLSFAFASVMRQHGSALIALSLLAVLLSHYAVSRRDEYRADRDAVLLTRNPEAAIRALAALYSKTNTPIERGALTELFMTHPDFAKRVSAITRLGAVSEDRLAQLLSEFGVSDDVFLPTR